MKPDYERIAGDYRKARPQYPERLVAMICRPAAGRASAGAGCGRRHRHRHPRALAGVLGPRAAILAIEPSPAMRQEAAVAAGIRWADGKAEALPSVDGAVGSRVLGPGAPLVRPPGLLAGMRAGAETRRRHRHPLQQPRLAPGRLRRRLRSAARTLQPGLPARLPRIRYRGRTRRARLDGPGVGGKARPGRGR